MRYDLIRNHKIQNLVLSALLLVGMGLLLGCVGWFIAGKVGFLIAVGAGAVLLLLSPGLSAHFAMKVSGARPLRYEQAPQLYDMTLTLSRRARLEATPRLYLLPSRELNAFATGESKDAAIALTSGLLHLLNPRELQGVLAHEISHLRNNDLSVMNLANTVNHLTRNLSFLGQILLLINLPMLVLGNFLVPWFLILVLIAAPLLSSLMQLTLSRTRELSADLSAAELTADPRGLASALMKLEHHRRTAWWQWLWPDFRRESPGWLRSHPNSEERVRRLLSFEKKPHHSQRKTSNSRVRAYPFIPRRYAPRRIEVTRRRPTMDHPWFLAATD